MEGLGYAVVILEVLGYVVCSHLGKITSECAVAVFEDLV